MNRITFLISAFTISATIIACGSGSDGGSSTGATGSGSGDGGGSAVPSTSAATKLSCLVTLNGFEPQCQFYEATGADAARTIDNLRAGCVDQASAKAKVLDACPPTDTLGGCKMPLKVQGTSDVKLFITSFEYKPGSDAGSFAHKTTAEIESLCKTQDAVYVASP